MNRFSDSFSDFFRKTDIVLWMLTIAAVIYSLLLISSMQRSGDYNYIRPQLTAVILGTAAAVFISFADYRFIIKKWREPNYGLQKCSAVLPRERQCI